MSFSLSHVLNGNFSHAFSQSNNYQKIILDQHTQNLEKEAAYWISGKSQYKIEVSALSHW